MDSNFLNSWLGLSSKDRADIFQETAKKRGLPASVIEKDWWVCLSLRVVFELEVAQHLVFKGGTSLSKGWRLIERFSEDIDLALDRSFLGFEGNLSRTQIGKLRKSSKVYIERSLMPTLHSAFSEKGINDINIQLGPVSSSDQDPLIIEIYYDGVTQTNEYIIPRVLLEIGCRSLREPFTICDISSIVGEEYHGSDFADPNISIPCVDPERTFLEKIFLLHEEFQKPEANIRVERLSRHLYDVYRIMSTEYADKAINNTELYNTIVEHRRLLTRVSGINYELRGVTIG